MANIIGASVRAGSKGERGEEGVYGSKVVVPKENQLRLRQFSVHKKLKLPVEVEKAMEEERERKGGGEQLGSWVSSNEEGAWRLCLVGCRHCHCHCWRLCFHNKFIDSIYFSIKINISIFSKLE